MWNKNLHDVFEKQFINIFLKIFASSIKSLLVFLAVVLSKSTCAKYPFGILKDVLPKIISKTPGAYGGDGVGGQSAFPSKISSIVAENVDSCSFLSLPIFTESAASKQLLVNCM